jgi:hypothetical protein
MRALTSAVGVDYPDSSDMVSYYAHPIRRTSAAAREDSAARLYSAPVVMCSNTISLSGLLVEG